MNKYLLLFSLVFAVAACKKESLTPEEQLALDKSLIEQDIADKQLDAEVTHTNVYYVLELQGSGGHPTLSSTVTVRYKGYLLDGTVFDQSPNGQTVSFPLEDLIPGWQEAIPLLQKGGKGTFWIPSVLAYGTYAVGSIPANSVLIFDIELVDFSG
jgi:FKBP-type peptidyl-prolyl cis-trans isomerase FkpA